MIKNLFIHANVFLVAYLFAQTNIAYFVLGWIATATITTLLEKYVFDKRKGKVNV